MSYHTETFKPKYLLKKAEHTYKFKREVRRNMKRLFYKCYGAAIQAELKAHGYEIERNNIYNAFSNVSNENEQLIVEAAIRLVKREQGNETERK